jgi:hypothetical protein
MFSPPNSMFFASVIYNGHYGKQDTLSSGETKHAAGESTRRRKINIMGDKNPKSNQKKSSQKQSKANSASQKKKAAVAAKKK